MGEALEHRNLKCPKCGHSWIYKGKSNEWVSCPKDNCKKCFIFDEEKLREREDWRKKMEKNKEIKFKVEKSDIDDRFNQWLFDNNIENQELNEDNYTKILELFSKALSSNKYTWLDSLDEAVDKLCSELFEGIDKTYKMKFEFIEEIIAKSEDEAHDKLIELIKNMSKDELIEGSNIFPEQ